MDSQERNRWKQALKARILEEVNLSSEMDDEALQERVLEAVLGEEGLFLLSPGDKADLAKELFDSLRKLDLLQLFVEDAQITEIMINGREHIFVERGGRLERLDRSFESEEMFFNVIQQIVSGCNRIVNESSPIVDARLGDGSRVNVVLPPVALNGPILTIRRFPQRPITSQDLVAGGSISREAMELLKLLVTAKYNIFISGGTGSGKTTFLNVLSGFIPKKERIITIEDSAELQLQDVDNLVRLETRNANVEGCLPVGMRDLLKSSLRMRPDRIILGEVRGAEAADLLQCLNTGHDGSMSTGHANSCKDMLSRLEMMVLMGMDIPLAAIKGQIASGLDIMVHLGRLRDGSRKVLEIVEVDGLEGDICLHPLYVFAEEGRGEKVRGQWQQKGELRNVGKLAAAGLDEGLARG